MFEWSHAPAASSQDSRCFSEVQCEELRAEAALPDSAAHSTEPGQLLGTPAMPCGWARSRNAPCLSPFVMASVSVLAFVGTACASYLYSHTFQRYSYRSMLTATQLVLLLVNMLDLVWVLRLNQRVGISDLAFVLGDEALGGVIGGLNLMPFLVYAAKLCPSAVEASMFAIFMGMSNLGNDTGLYMGSGLLRFLGGVAAPDFDRLPDYIFWRSCARVLPIMLVPLLVPRGSPSDTAESMGAGIGVTGDDDTTSSTGTPSTHDEASGTGSRGKPSSQHGDAIGRAAAEML